VSATVRNKRNGKFPYFGATGQIGWIDDYRQDGTYVLLGEDGAPFLDKTKNKAYIVRGKCWVNNHAHVLKGKPDICDDEFLCHALNWADYREAVTGSTRLKLPQNTMNKVLLPAPTMEEQIFIARQLTAALEQVTGVRKALEAQLSDVEALSWRVLDNSF
jgi:type I restriction enzyme S subunit